MEVRTKGMLGTDPTAKYVPAVVYSIDGKSVDGPNKLVIRTDVSSDRPIVEQGSAEKYFFMQFTDGH